MPRLEKQPSSNNLLPQLSLITASPSQTDLSATSTLLRLQNSCARLQSLCRARPEIYPRAVSMLDDLIHVLEAPSPIPTPVPVTAVTPAVLEQQTTSSISLLGSDSAKGGDGRMRRNRSSTQICEISSTDEDAWQQFMNTNGQDSPSTKNAERGGGGVGPVEMPPASLRLPPESQNIRSHSRSQKSRHDDTSGVPFVVTEQPDQRTSSKQPPQAPAISLRSSEGGLDLDLNLGDEDADWLAPHPVSKRARDAHSRDAAGLVTDYSSSFLSGQAGQPPTHPTPTLGPQPSSRRPKSSVPF